MLAPTSPATAAPKSSRITPTTIAISRSMAVARKRVPRPASGSSSSTPSGVAIVRDSSYSIADIMMSPELFQAERADGWAELDGMLRHAGDRPERLGADGVRRLGALYRSAAADLAFARRAYP